MKRLTFTLSDTELRILHGLNKLLNEHGEEIKLRVEYHFENNKIQNVFCFAFKNEYDDSLEEGLINSTSISWYDFNDILFINENTRTMFEYINMYIDDYPEFKALSKLFKPLENCSSLEELQVKLDLMGV